MAEIHRNTAAATRGLATPIAISNGAEASRKKVVGDTDAGAEVAPDVAGTIAAVGQGPLSHGMLDSGGILADILRARPRMPVPEARPNSPLVIGGDVKPPQLITMVEPVYPPLLRSAKV